MATGVTCTREELTLQQEGEGGEGIVIAGVAGDTETGPRMYLVDIPSGPTSGELLQGRLQAMPLYFAILGGLLVLSGLIAVVAPIIFVVAVDGMIEWILVVGGAVIFVHGFLMFGAPPAGCVLLLGVVYVAFGLCMIISPLHPGSTFIWVLVGWFILQGMVKMMIGRQLRSVEMSWLAMLVDGVVSVVLGLVVLVLSLRRRGDGIGSFVGFVFGADIFMFGIFTLAISLFVSLATTMTPFAQDPSRESLLEGSRHIGSMG